jgi:putative superfamily III holin-X
VAEGQGIGDRRSTPKLVRSIATDSATLVRKEVELARQEMIEALVARVKAATAMIVAGIVSLIAIVFGGAAAASALDTVMEPWASRLVVAGGFLLTAAIAAVAGMARKAPPFAPEKTVETVKEDIEWAKTQLKR